MTNSTITRNQAIQLVQKLKCTALTAGREALGQGEAVDCAYYSSQGGCCESGEPCKADRHNDALDTYPQAKGPAPADRLCE